MEEIFNYILNLNWQTCVAMITIGWFFTREIKSTLIKLEADVKAQGARTDKLYEMFVQNQKEFHEEMKNIHGRVNTIEERIKK